MISVYPLPVQTVTVSNTVQTEDSKQLERLKDLIIESKINNMYNYKKTDEDINKEDIEEG